MRRFPIILTLLCAVPALAMTRKPTPAPKLPDKPAVTQPVAAVVATTTPTLTPYTAFAWLKPTSPLSHVAGVFWYNDTTTRPADIQYLAAELKAIPTGSRAMIRGMATDLVGNGADYLPVPASATTLPVPAQRGPWMPAGRDAEAAFETSILGQLKAAGATVDYLILDTECGISTWTLTPAQLAAIQADPRYPALATRYAIPATVPVGWLNPASQAFALAMQVTQGQYLHDAFTAPLQAVFPAAHCSDWLDGVLPASVAAQAPDPNGCVQPMALPMHGDVQAPAYYGTPGGIQRQGVVASNPLSLLAWQVSSIRAYAQASPPIIPWVCGESYAGGALTGSPYYHELLWHLLLSAGGTNLNLWNADPAHAQDDAAAVDQDLATLQSETGGSPTLATLTTAAVPYTSSVVMSAARCNSGRRVYRVTIAATAPTTQSVSVTLPGDTAATVVDVVAGECGAWVSK